MEEGTCRGIVHVQHVAAIAHVPSHRCGLFYLTLFCCQVEYEIQTMRQVLTAKLRKSQELKRKLGITAWGEFQNDISQGLRNVKETPT